LPPDTRHTLRHYLWAAIVVAVALAIYLPGLGNQLVYDDGALTDGNLFTDYRSLALRSRMLSYGSFVWIQSLLGEGWWKQRLLNVVIHVAVVGVLWGFYREILRALTAPDPDPGEERVPYHASPALGVAVGFFALNPVAVYAVAYLIQRSILLATFFTVVALWLFALGLRTGKWWLHLLAAISYALAVLSKEHAVLAPLAAVPVYIVVAPLRECGWQWLQSHRDAHRGRGCTALRDSATSSGAVRRILPLSRAARRPEPDAPRHAWPPVINQCWLFFQYGLRWFFLSATGCVSIRPPFPVTDELPADPRRSVISRGDRGGFRLIVRYRDWRAGRPVAPFGDPLRDEFVTVGPGSVRAVSQLPCDRRQGSCSCFFTAPGPGPSRWWGPSWGPVRLRQSSASCRFRRQRPPGPTRS
jgi:hypothetical protein